MLADVIFYGKLCTLQNLFVVGTNLDETFTVVDAIGWDGKSDSICDCFK